MPGLALHALVVNLEDEEVVRCHACGVVGQLRDLHFAASGAAVGVVEDAAGCPVVDDVVVRIMRVSTGVEERCVERPATAEGGHEVVVQQDAVGRVVEVRDDITRCRRDRRVEDEEIVTEATGQDIDTSAAGQAIVACTAVQNIISDITEQLVVAVAAQERVIARLTVQHVVASFAQERIVAVATLEIVGTIATEQTVIAIAAEQLVVAQPTEQRVVAGEAGQHVVQFVAGDGVVELVAGTIDRRPQKDQVLDVVRAVRAEEGQRAVDGGADRVHTTGIDDRVLAVRLGAECIGIVAEATLKMVATSAAVEAVVAIAAEHLVIAIATHQGVVAESAAHGVVTGATIELVVAAITIDDVVSAKTVDRVIARKSGEEVVVRVAVDHVGKIVADADDGRANEREVFDVAQHACRVGQREVHRRLHFIDAIAVVGCFIHDLEGAGDDVSIVPLPALHRVETAEDAVQDVIAAETAQQVACRTARQVVIGLRADGVLDGDQGIGVSETVRCRAGAEIDRHTGRATTSSIAVVSRGIRPGAAVENVEAAQTAEGLVVAIAGHEIHELRADKGLDRIDRLDVALPVERNVCTCNHDHAIGRQRIRVAVGPIDFVVAGATVVGIVTTPADHGVVTIAAVQGVVTVTAEDVVVATVAVERIVAAPACDIVVAGRTVHGVIARHDELDCRERRDVQRVLEVDAELNESGRLFLDGHVIEGVDGDDLDRQNETARDMAGRIVGQADAVETHLRTRRARKGLLGGAAHNVSAGADDQFVQRRVDIETGKIASRESIVIGTHLKFSWFKAHE